MEEFADLRHGGRRDLGRLRDYLRLRQIGALRCHCGGDATHVTSEGGFCANCWTDRRHAQTVEQFNHMAARR
jgi:hypothetical protein